MIKKEFAGKELSLLGYGAMRLPQLATGGIDVPEAERLIAKAYESGVNYFDTAYSYHSGQSERVLGKALSRFPRESYFLASKFPGHEIRKSYNVSGIFEDQLSKCGVDYFDFYLLHNVNESSVKNYKNPQLDILGYLIEQKKLGRIKHLGISAHARPETLRDFLDFAGDNIEFCQIQLNYLDWTLQKAREKYDLLTERGIPVWVMEPVRGGKLAKLDADAEKTLKGFRPDDSIASWCFRWLQDLPNVGMILSGMSTMEQVVDNLATFESRKPLSNEERAALAKIASDMSGMLPCTSCRYCCRSCPQELDIPTLLSMYDDCRFQTSVQVSVMLDAMPEDKLPSACIKCGNCRSVCPQEIDVPDLLEKFAEMRSTLPSWKELSAQREAEQPM